MQLLLILRWQEGLAVMLELGQRGEELLGSMSALHEGISLAALGLCPMLTRHMGHKDQSSQAIFLWGLFGAMAALHAYAQAAHCNMP